MSETKATAQKEAEKPKTLSHRHETLFLWDVRKSNPNGDPNGNEPRMDRYTKRCDVTDVCVKRAVRDYIGRENGVGSLLVTRLGLRIVTLTERLEEFAGEDNVPNAVRSCLTQNGIDPETVVSKLEEVSEQLKALKTSKDPKTKDDNIRKEVEKEQQTLKEIYKFLTEKSTKSLKILLDNDTLRRSLTRSLRKLLCDQFLDLRMFGSVLAIRGGSDLAELGGPLTGPIQIEIGTSLHRVVQSNKQITSVMAPDKKQNVSEEGEEAEHGGGLFGDTHCLEYGLFATSAIANEYAAEDTGLTDEDHELFLKALWRGMRERHTRSKNAVPRLLIDIEYSKPFHCGDLLSTVELEPVERDGKKLEEEQFRELKDFSLKLDKLYAKLKKHKAIIEKIRFASNDLLDKESFKEGLETELRTKVHEFVDIDYDLDPANTRV